jgi:hypothetical protein
MSRRPSIEPETLPRREVLEALARQYHHLHTEITSRRQGSGVRRRLEKKEMGVRERFERLLAEWVPDLDLRQAWRDHLDMHTPRPAGPPAVRPLVFRGQSEDVGSVVEVRRGRDGLLNVEVDGALVERLDADENLALTAPRLAFHLDHTAFRETFSASTEALGALAAFASEGGSPPWEHAEELLADGLVDPAFALTPRGRRALPRRAEPAGGPLSR